ncbi:dynein regulatory complex protein 8-like isoform X2 [Tigriopus californicus]|uniref:dynein regulatory complex protein 8-like isoform X2 n=1 Tax=Tigriopus californicus TaxID=6832 RepID=UPI0027DA8261|nr:dynein regulatory complex protein 8-like isoform X2 [Tigriopus californicus]
MLKWVCLINTFTVDDGFLVIVMEGIESVGKDKPEIASAELKQRVVQAFQIFDHDQTNSVDVREIGTIIRSLDETELQSVVQEMEDTTQEGVVSLDRFTPVVLKIIADQRYRSAPIDDLLTAFQVLDVDGKGHLSEDELRRYFQYKGEVFQPDEMEELFNAAFDNQSKVVNYESFVHLLAIEDDNLS